jgi:hypothetical protein
MGQSAEDRVHGAKGMIKPESANLSKAIADSS